jgi:hypothetical protein
MPDFGYRFLVPSSCGLIVGRYEFELLEHNEAPLKLDHATCTLLLKYQKMERECVNGILAFALQCRD